MAYSAKILKDSISPLGQRLTTFEVTFPRIVLAEFNTHRMFSRNSASSRAIPVEKMLARVKDDPFIPQYWGKNQKGMQANQEISDDDQAQANFDWLQARDFAVKSAQALAGIGVHKQITNRLLEPFMWHTVIVTATEYQNFFALRCHPDAQPEIRRIAEMVRALYEESLPTQLGFGEWHLPLVQESETDLFDLGIEAVKQVSAGRCARVSYLTHDGKRDPKADIELCERLRSSGHMSPLEHVACAVDTADFIGNFRGWKQYRKEFAGEAVFE